MEAALEDIDALLLAFRGMRGEGQEIVRTCTAARKTLNTLKRQVESDLESVKTSWTERLLDFKDGLRRLL